MIVEVSQFRLVPGTEEERFLEAADETQRGFLANQDGFRGRELLRSEDGSWMDIVRFKSAEAAQAAFGGFAGHPSTEAFEKMLDVTSVGMSHCRLQGSGPPPIPTAEGITRDGGTIGPTGGASVDEAATGAILLVRVSASHHAFLQEY